MDITVETTSGLERKILVNLPAEQVEPQVKAKISELSRRVKLPGFRPGKVPVSVIEKRFGGQARAEVFETLLQSSYEEAIKSNELNPAGQPKIEPGENKPGEGFSYTATLEVYPEFELAGLDGIKVEKPVCEVTDADLDEMLETLQKQRTTYEKVERAAADNDRVTVDFSAKIKGEDFPGNTGEAVEIRLEADALPEVFDGPFRKALTGQEAGADVEFKIKFPKDYNVEDIAGKTADYSVTIKEVAEPTVPELNDEFAVGFGITEGGLDKLKEQLRERMDQEVDNKVRAQLKEQVLDSLAEANPVELPKVMVQNEIKELRHRTMHDMGMGQDQLENAKAPQLPDELFADQAEKRVRLGLLFGKLVKDKELKADPEKVSAQLQRMMGNYEDPQQVLQMYQSNPQAMANLEMAALEEQVIDLLVESAEVKENKVSFKDLTEAQAA